MAEKSFGVKEINLIGASGTPTIESPNNLNLNAVNVAISTNVSIGGTLSVTGNVSIGGTLTYEEVTNIDSIGIITARSQLNVGNNIKLGNAGVITATSFVGDGSGLTGISGGGSGISTISGVVSIANDLDVDGHTNLDNVSISGLTTTSGYLNAADRLYFDYGTGTKYMYGSGADIKTFISSEGNFEIALNQSGGTGGTFIVERSSGNSLLEAKGTGVVDISGDLDVDGHTNLDNVSIAGITTFNEDINLATGKDINWNTNHSFKIIDYTTAWIYQAGGGNVIWRLNESQGVDGDFIIQTNNSGTGSRKTLLRLHGTGETELYHLGNKKLETTSSGVTVTGTLSATTFSGSGANLTNLPSSQLSGSLPSISGANLTNLPSPDPSDTDVQVTFDIAGGAGSGYTFTGPGNDGTTGNPDIYLIRGQRYRFNNTTGSNHPFEFRNADNNADYTDGITGSQSGIQDFNVQYDAPAQLKYRCTIHTVSMLGNIYITGGPQGGVTYELISQGASISAGTYIDISGYKAVYFQGYNDPATNGDNRHGPYLSTSNSSNSGVSTRNGRWWRLNTSNGYDSASWSPSTSGLYYGANLSDDADKVWMLEILGLDQTNVFLRTSAHRSYSAYPSSGWVANTSSAISTPYLYFHQALLQYIVYGVK